MVAFYADDNRPAVAHGPSRTAVGTPIAVAAIILVAVSLRPGIVSIGPVLPSILDEFRLSHATGSLLTAIPDILMGALALPSPWLARRFGRDRILLLALALLFISSAVRAFSLNAVSLIGSTIGVGAGIAIAGTLIGGFVKARFPARAALLMGVYATALSLGSTVAAAFTGPVALRGASGWRLATGMWSATAIVAIGAWIAVVASERTRHAPVPAAAPALPSKLPLGNPTAWLIAIFFAIQSFIFYGLLAWASPMYREVGLSATTAGFLLASYTLAFMISNPVLGWLSKSEDRRVWLAICSALTLLGLLAIAIAPRCAPFVSIPVCAFGLGGAFTLGMTLPLDNAESVEDANVWNAFVLTIGYLVAAGGPLVIGYLRDVSGNFTPSSWLLVILGAAILALTPFLQPHHHRSAA